ncbi:trypsin-like serine protease [Rubrobacter taiwanensis]|uniref:Trypsin-like serine protease n=1 Tax=Rubrobacter taiwanensis TaxID=185139 RepID=A0A4R1BSH1_9ACTN|nr:trypsin-like peptidase domain-containing protein [Rubrobacter taiwanensis]TCJ20754.1 trypsin-like serine protease [Rubrobacter taiwanensis]
MPDRIWFRISGGRRSAGGRFSALKTALTSLVSAVIGGLVAILLVAAGVLGIDDAPTGDVTINEVAPESLPRSDAPAAGPGALPVREIYTRDGPGVVSVEVQSNGSLGGGSGFVLDESGHILTNQHVIDGAERVLIQFSSGARAEAEIVGEDPSTDIAVLRVEETGEPLVPLTLGDSDSVRVGDPVIAIGNPLNVGASVTTGIVSGIGRAIKAPNDFTIDGAIQTDAAINPGNSGGPLLDARGLVVGVNSQIISETGGFQGVGFAVPINTVKDVVRQLITTGEVRHGYLGVQMFSVGVEELAAYSGLSPEEFSREHGLPENGAIVTDVVPDGPADRAGIRGGREEREIAGLPVPIGDVITEIDGEPVRDSEDVIRAVNASRPGDELDLTVVSPGGEPRTERVTLGVQPSQTP